MSNVTFTLNVFILVWHGSKNPKFCALGDDLKELCLLLLLLAAFSLVVSLTNNNRKNYLALMNKIKMIFPSCN